MGEHTQARATARRAIHAEGLHAIASTALSWSGQATEPLFERVVALIGAAFAMDRVLVFDLSLSRSVATGLCEWLNPEAGDIPGLRAIYPLEVFGAAIGHLVDGRAVQSFVDDPNPALGASWQIVHEQMGIRWLHWQPFAAHSDGFYVLVANRVIERAHEPWDELGAAIHQATDLVERALARAAHDAAEREVHTALAEQVARYRELYDDTPSMFFTVADDGAITGLNRFAEEHLGYRPHALLGTPLVDLVFPADRERFQRHLDNCFAHPGTVHHLEFRKLTRGGDVVWVRQTVRASRRSPPEALVVCDDISVQRVAEAALQQTQRLDSLGVLAGGIAHDFNNLLHAILANTDLALMRLGPESAALLPLERAARAAVRASELVRGLLTYAGKAPPSSGPVHLGRLVAETADLLSVSVGGTAAIRLELAPELPLVECDASQIRQVLTNLVVNAAEAIEESGGRGGITVRTLVSTPSVAEPGARWVRIEVSDDGIGMDAATQARMFDPFFSTKFAGRGLGLAAVAGILRMHGGRIEVDSAPKRGTTFAIDFPALPALPAVGARAPKGDSASASERRASIAGTPAAVLLVDDDELVRSVLADLLGAHGYTPVVASGGAEALALLADHPEIEAVILDLSMPDGGGVPVLRELRKRAVALPIIMTSGLAEADAMDRLSADHDRIDGFLPKPFSPRLMLEVLEQALAGGRVVR